MRAKVQEETIAPHDKLTEICSPIPGGSVQEAQGEETTAGTSCPYLPLDVRSKGGSNQPCTFPRALADYEQLYMQIRGR